ncbi:peptide chain release factor N(5)-glutamine methyltransferase [Candidatus Dojkabacteria bacterium]|nr:peptide chain release factor N(5)-glutamine methyltransferase [Candidatus Dojkabacteria bacterium]
MTISQLLQRGSKILSKKSHTPELDSEVLLAFALAKSKSYLLSHGEQSVSPAKTKKFLKLISKRLKREPIAYLANKKEFYGLDFYVDRDVLIPRPETEQLVDMAYDVIVSLFKKGQKEIRIIDVGTGCGNIAIALIHKIIEQRLNKKVVFTIYLSDISGKALEIARKNYKKIIKDKDSFKVNFVKSDLLSGMGCCFDIIVSNPPYIPKRQIEYLEPNVRDFEPKVALDGGVGGIEIIKKLIFQSIDRLKEGSVLIFEMHEKHPNEIKYYLEENFPEWKADFHKDCFGMWRFAKVSKQKIANSQTVG